MAQNTGTQIVAPIVTPDSSDKFPTHINAMGQGGFKAVQSLAERDAIPMERRENGMLCSVLANDTVYQLKGGIDNAFWTIFTTGAGGATTGADLAYTPSGNLTATNLQVAIDQLENNKVDIVNVYSKSEVDDKVNNHVYSFSSLSDKPDLTSLHTHLNKATLDKFSELGGNLVWAGKTIGDMVASIYDSDKDGVIDKAKTLSGLTTTIDMLNYTSGLTGNIQAQINAISSGTVFKGEYTNWASMNAAIPSPEKGFWVFVISDETRGNARTQYYHDGTAWIYGGGAISVPAATASLSGVIKLGGVLENPLSTADAPQLKPSGVLSGNYTGANITIGDDGRITYAENGSAASVNDDVITQQDVWSSTKVSTELANKSDKNHTHAQLHDSDVIGNIKVDMTNIGNDRVLGYKSSTGKAQWIDPQGGRVYVGSKVINGDFRLVAGAYVSLSIDEVQKTITINSTGGGGGSVPTLTEITSTLTVPAGASILADIDAAFSKYDIRTVEMTNSVGVMMDIEVFDSTMSNKRRIYQSNKETYIYDIVNVPCHDKDESAKLHVQVTNYGSVSADINIVVATTNLI